MSSQQSIPHIVVIGFGPVASRFIDGMVGDVEAGRITLTVIGSERLSAYQRIRIGDVSVGRIAPEELSMGTASTLESSGVDLRLGETVTAVDVPRHLLTLTTQSQETTEIVYSKVIFATGAAPVIPPMSVELRRQGRIDAELKSVEYPQGVIALRDMQDALAVRSVVERGGSVVVLGGGVLGVEAALALAEEGVAVTLIHRGKLPMSQQLGPDAAMLLRSELVKAHVEIRSGCDVDTVVSENGLLTAVRTSQGEKLPASLLITCTGIKPRYELAAAAGLPTAGGISTTFDTRSTGKGQGHGDVFAIGDCAAFDGRAPAGLIASGWLQADIAAATVRADLGFAEDLSVDAAGLPVECDQPSEHHSDSAGLDVVLLKSKTLNMAYAGDIDQNPWSNAPMASGSPKVSLWSDPQRGQYLRIVTEARPHESDPTVPSTDRLVGFVSIGMPRSAAELALYAARGAVPVTDMTALLAAEHASREAKLGPDDVLCRCAGTLVGAVEEAAATSCETVSDISAVTKAGTGCGTCHRTIEKVLASAQSV